MSVNLTINGIAVTVEEGATVMKAAEKCGVFIPHFCYHPKLSIAANCRMCMVDVQKAPKALPACATPVSNGMVVNTASERAKTAQQTVMEFLLINHPLDCPICDQGGECQLQDLAVGYGVSQSRYEEEKRVVFEKQLGPLIATDMTRCIHCTRCVRFGREVAGVMELGMVGRGEHAEIMPFIEKTVDSEISGNMIDVCPVGALTSKPFRYSARTWELSRKKAISTHDSWGSHLVAQIKGSEVKRVVPQDDKTIHEHWISDRDRFSYEGLYAEDRATEPLERTKIENTYKPIPWQTAIAHLKSHLINCIKKHGADQVGFFISPRATQQEAYILQKMARQLGCENIESRLWQRNFNATLAPGLGLADSALKNIKSVLFIGADPARELPLLPAYFRQPHKKNVWISALGSTDIAHQFNLKTSTVVSTDKIINELVSLIEAAGGIPEFKIQGNGDAASDDLFSTSTPVDKTAAQSIISRLQKNKDTAIIWLGDAVRASEQYGMILSLAKHLSRLCDCKIGTLFDGANGVGLQAIGAIPHSAKINTASLLRANLKGVVLFRCEPSDFSERELAIRMLDEAEFSCALTSHSSEVNSLVDMILPTADFAENEGSYINGFGCTETFQAAVPPYKNSKPAWKILRLLAESIHEQGYSFNTLAQINAEMADFKWAPTPAEDEVEPIPAPAPGSLVVYRGQASYGTDMLVRRATALQATANARSLDQIGLNPTDMEKLSLKQGDQIELLDNTLPPLTVRADNRLAKGMIKYHPTVLSSQLTVSIKKIADKVSA